MKNRHKWTQLCKMTGKEQRGAFLRGKVKNGERRYTSIGKNVHNVARHFQKVNRKSPCCRWHKWRKKDWRREQMADRWSPPGLYYRRH